MPERSEAFTKTSATLCQHKKTGGTNCMPAINSSFYAGEQTEVDIPIFSGASSELLSYNRFSGYKIYHKFRKYFSYSLLLWPYL